MPIGCLLEEFLLSVSAVDRKISTSLSTADIVVNDFQHEDHDDTGVEHEQARKTEIVESLKRRSDHTLA